MKTLYFFDIDGTLYDNANQKIHKSTITAIKKLAKNKNNTLGLATGRSNGQLQVVKPVLKYFKYKILINGAVVYDSNKKLYEFPINDEQIEKVLKFSEEKDIGVAFIGEKKFALTTVNEFIINSTRVHSFEVPKIDPKYYKRNSVYQLWVFTEDKEIMKEYETTFSNLTHYLWSRHGFDIVDLNVNKGDMALKLKNKFNYDRLITIGDGPNDFSLLKNADIGICMGNSKYEKLKKAATHVSLPINEDGLYKILKDLSLI